MQLVCSSIVLVFVVFVVGVSKGQLFEGDTCSLGNGVYGLCKFAEECPGIANTIASGKSPKICSFTDLKTIVCCPVPQSRPPTNTESITTTTTTTTTGDERVPWEAPSNTSDVCILHNGARGECTRLQNCTRVRNWIINGNDRLVRRCGVAGSVCCPINFLTLSAQSRPETPSVNSQRSTRPPQGVRTTSRPTTQLPSSAVGAKSAAMCDYFSQFVFVLRESATLLIIKEYYNESQCNSRDFIANQAPMRDVEQALYLEFPHLASLGYGNESSIKWLCSGSLISERFILTTAHCLHSPNNGKVRWAVIGDLLPSVHTADTRPPYVVSEWIRHEDYRESSPTKHDIALIKLERDVDVGVRSRPACLYSQPGNPPRRQFATAAGWGRTDWDDTTTTTRLMKKDLTFAPEAECTSTSQRSDSGNSSVICMSDPSPEESSCVGDLGGPLQIVLEAPYCMTGIVGLTSYGPRACANATSPAVYTRVSDYIAWIEDHVWP